MSEYPSAGKPQPVSTNPLNTTKIHSADKPHPISNVPSLITTRPSTEKPQPVSTISSTTPGLHSALQDKPHIPSKATTNPQLVSTTPSTTPRPHSALQDKPQPINNFPSRFLPAKPQPIGMSPKAQRQIPDIETALESFCRWDMEDDILRAECFGSRPMLFIPHHYIKTLHRLVESSKKIGPSQETKIEVVLEDADGWRSIEAAQRALDELGSDLQEAIGWIEDKELLYEQETKKLDEAEGRVARRLRRLEQTQSLVHHPLTKIAAEVTNTLTFPVPAASLGLEVVGTGVQVAMTLKEKRLSRIAKAKLTNTQNLEATEQLKSRSMFQNHAASITLIDEWRSEIKAVENQLERLVDRYRPTLIRKLYNDIGTFQLFVDICTTVLLELEDVEEFFASKEKREEYTTILQKAFKQMKDFYEDLYNRYLALQYPDDLAKLSQSPRFQLNQSTLGKALGQLLSCINKALGKLTTESRSTTSRILVGKKRKHEKAEEEAAEEAIGRIRDQMHTLYSGVKALAGHPLTYLPGCCNSLSKGKAKEAGHWEKDLPPAPGPSQPEPAKVKDQHARFQIAKLDREQDEDEGTVQVISPDLPDVFEDEIRSPEELLAELIPEGLLDILCTLSRASGRLGRCIPEDKSKAQRA